jgi:hypothetical protein
VREAEDHARYVRKVKATYWRAIKAKKASGFKDWINCGAPELKIFLVAGCVFRQYAAFKNSCCLSFVQS